MTSVLPMHIFSISENAVGRFRDSVAPLKKNNWNRAHDFLFKTRPGLVICGVSFVLFLCTMLLGSWLSQYIPHGIVLLGALPFFFIFGVSRLSEDLTAKRPKWLHSSVMNYMTQERPSATEIELIYSTIVDSRRSDPIAEFEIEYLEPGTKKRPLPKALVLWKNSHPYEVGKRMARLVIKDGMPVILHTLAHPPITPHA